MTKISNASIYSLRLNFHLFHLYCLKPNDRLCLSGTGLKKNSPASMFSAGQTWTSKNKIRIDQTFTRNIEITKYV